MLPLTVTASWAASGENPGGSNCSAGSSRWPRPVTSSPVSGASAAVLDCWTDSDWKRAAPAPRPPARANRPAAVGAAVGAVRSDGAGPDAALAGAPGVRDNSDSEASTTAAHGGA